MISTHENRELAGIEEFWLRLGRFVMTFADVEASLHIYLMLIFKLDWKIFNASFGGVRVDQGIQIICRVKKAQGGEIALQMDRTLTQLEKINRIRNHLLHNKPNIEDQVTGEGVVHDSYRAMPDKIKKLKISPEILKKLTNDLDRIQRYLAVFAVEGQGVPVPADLLESFKQGIDDPWSFKGNIETGPSSQPQA